MVPLRTPCCAHSAAWCPEGPGWCVRVRLSRELSLHVTAAEVAGAVTAVHPDPCCWRPGGNLNHWVVVLPGRVAGRTLLRCWRCNRLESFIAADQRQPPALGRLRSLGQRRGVRELLRVVRGQDQRGTADIERPTAALFVRHALAACKPAGTSLVRKAPLVGAVLAKIAKG